MSDIPLFIGEGPSAPHPDLEFKERDAVTGIVRSSKTGEYLCLRWVHNDAVTFVTGGIEEGQSAEDAARAEILQETGYKHLRLIAELPQFDARFFHELKQVNRYAHFRSFFFELVDNARDVVAEAEHQRHTPVWITPDELVGLRLLPEHHFLFEKAVRCS